jgi:hypothetical protein
MVFYFEQNDNMMKFNTKKRNVSTVIQFQKLERAKEETGRLLKTQQKRTLSFC